MVVRRAEHKNLVITLSMEVRFRVPSSSINDSETIYHESSEI